MPAEGEVRINKVDPTRQAVFQGGVWIERAAVPPGSTARPDYGPGAYETPDGGVLKPGRSGGVQVLKPPQQAGAESRTRLILGLPSAVEAQKNMYASEKWNQPGADDPRGQNPYDTPTGMVANMLNPHDPTKTLRTVASKVVGGQDYQDYNQATKSFEAAFLPILSGAAVTPSEASRMISASLPEPGDTPATLAKKSKNRAMMINGAAKLLGEKPPFPKIPVMDFGSGQTPAQPGAQPAAAPAGGGDILTIDLNGRPVK
jgi:hypothetical protein